jgi:hypothetical protein
VEVQQEVLLLDFHKDSMSLHLWMLMIYSDNSLEEETHLVAFSMMIMMIWWEDLVLDKWEDQAWKIKVELVNKKIEEEMHLDLMIMTCLEVDLEVILEALAVDLAALDKALVKVCSKISVELVAQATLLFHQVHFLEAQVLPLLKLKHS